MKTLYLIRHAKSSWENKNVSDYERPLNDRGKRDAPFMAGILKKKSVKIDLILSSPANRALTTAKIFAKEVGIPETKIITNENIYGANKNDLLKVLLETDDTVNNLMLFGHNPGLTYLSNYICDFSQRDVRRTPYGGFPETDNIPTCGIIGMQLDFDSWKYIGSKSCSFKFFEYPKKYL